MYQYDVIYIYGIYIYIHFSHRVVAGFTAQNWRTGPVTSLRSIWPLLG